MTSVSRSRHLFISGGTRGIGRAITLAQAAKGTTLFVNYLRDADAADSLRREAEAKGAAVHLIAGNVGDADSVKEIFGAVSAATDRLDAIVHNAAIGVFKPVHQLRAKDWDISMDVNARALLVLCQSALPLMKKHGGRVVAISSLGSHRYTPNYGAIGLSKSVLENLVRYLAVELAPHKIRVNGVSGGLVDTESIRMFPDFEKLKIEFLSRTPGGRIGRPEDIARVVSFLLDPASDWIYGQTIIADGGYSLS